MGKDHQAERAEKNDTKGHQMGTQTDKTPHCHHICNKKCSNTEERRKLAGKQHQNNSARSGPTRTRPDRPTKRARIQRRPNTPRHPMEILDTLPQRHLMPIPSKGGDACSHITAGREQTDKRPHLGYRGRQTHQPFRTMRSPATTKQATATIGSCDKAAVQ